MRARTPSVRSATGCINEKSALHERDISRAVDWNFPAAGGATRSARVRGAKDNDTRVGGSFEHHAIEPAAID